MALKVNGCCCCSLRTGALIQGWIVLVCVVLQIIVSTFIICFVSAYKTSEIKIEIWKVIAAFIVYILAALISGLLIKGASENKHKLLLPWLILRGLGLGIVTAGYCVLLVCTLIEDPKSIIPALLFFCVVGFEFWCWVVIYSLYQEIRDARNNQFTMPYCESQSMPNEPNAPPYHSLHFEK